MVESYIWRWRVRLPERYGQKCRVLARGTMNSCMLEFEDGFRVITSRNGIRKAPPPPIRASAGKGCDE